MDVLADPGNCGACAEVCAAGEYCQAGICTVPCAPDDPTCSPECSSSPFPECADYEPIAIETPTDCSVPRLVSFTPPIFSPAGMEFDITLACIGDPDEIPHLVTVLGYIPSQGLWDEFNASYWTFSEPAPDGSVQVTIPVDSIDETVLADVDPCAGWMVGFSTSVDGVERYWGMVATHTVETRRPVAAVTQPNESFPSPSCVRASRSPGEPSPTPLHQPNPRRAGASRPHLIPQTTARVRAG